MTANVMDEMNRKKLYIWRLARFLNSNETTMSVAELADRLNRNGFKTRANEGFEGGRGMHGLVKQTVIWVRDTLGLGETESLCITKSFPNEAGSVEHLSKG